MKSMKIKTPRGAELEAVLYKPESQSRVPAIIIGPGQGYHMELPLVKQLAEKIAAKGYAALRFNWNYHTESTAPSKGLINELEDYTAAVDFLKNNEFIDQTNIIVVGKSLGSLVSCRYFKQDPLIKALVLMTPLCSSKRSVDGSILEEPISTAAKYYPKLLIDERPVFMALGNRDDLCSLPVLYDFLKDSKGNISTTIVEGDHGMCVGDKDDEVYKDRNTDNINVVLDTVVHWVNLIFRK